MYKPFSPPPPLLPLYLAFAVAVAVFDNFHVSIFHYMQQVNPLLLFLMLLLLLLLVLLQNYLCIMLAKWAYVGMAKPVTVLMLSYPRCDAMRYEQKGIPFTSMEYSLWLGNVIYICQQLTFDRLC